MKESVDINISAPYGVVVRIENIFIDTNTQEDSDDGDGGGDDFPEAPEPDPAPSFAVDPPLRNTLSGSNVYMAAVGTPLFPASVIREMNGDDARSRSLPPDGIRGKKYYCGAQGCPGSKTVHGRSGQWR